MMNLEKMKQKKSKNSVKKGLLAATTILCLTSPMLQTQSVLAAENTAPAITIEKPDGWRQGETAVAITVDASHMPEGFSITKIEAKAGKDGSWQDVTGNGSISITGNQTVYVRVTDGEGKVYEQNRSIKCYDTEKPTLSASLTDGVLTIQGNDTVSGITSVTVNGTTYTDLKDGMLRVQLTQKDFTTKQIEITVTDGAGNTSEKYVLQNPYYEWAKKQAEKQKTSGDSNGAMATTTSADATGTEKTTTSPLPQDAQASEPTDAKGTVDDRTVTGIEEQLNKEGETADSVTKTATEGTKEFYTISTKSGKIFYLIIDNSKSQDNVYFLTEVSEKDLMNFTLSDSVTLPEVDIVYAEPEKQAEEEKPETTETDEKDKVEDEIQMPEDKSLAGTYLLIGLVAVGAAAGGYYLKVYAKKSGLDVDTVILSPMSHAGYYPGGKVMTMKVVFEKETYRLLGAQIIGYEGVDKRIDVLATAIHAGLKATQLKDLDLAYAPPYSSAKDPVNMAGFMIDNIAKGTLKQWHLEDMDKISKDKSVVLLDVRTVGEFNRGHMDGFRNIPVDELRERINEIEKGKPVYLICQSGLRSYIASRILEGNGYETYNFSGGFRFYDAVVNDRALIERAYACGMDY